MKLGDHEAVGADATVRTKMLSMKFPVESMIMGVVGQLIPHPNFDGRIL